MSVSPRPIAATCKSLRLLPYCTRVVQDMAAASYTKAFSTLNPTLYIVVVGLLAAEILILIVPIVIKVVGSSSLLSEAHAPTVHLLLSVT